MKLLGLFLLFASVFLTSASYASSCFTPDPEYRDRGDDYFSRDILPMQKDDADSVKSFFRSMEGEWSGSGMIMDCLGSENNPKIVINTVDEADIAAIFKQSQGMSFRHRVHLLEKKQSRSYERTLGPVKYLMLGDNRSSNMLSIRMLQPPTGAFRVSEYEFQLLADEQLSIKVSHYSGSVLVGTEYWDMQAD